MKVWKKPPVLVAFALLLVLAVKTLSVMIAAAASHEVAMERRSLRLAEVRPSAEQLAAEVLQLNRSLAWAPHDADTWYLRGRNQHRLAAAGAMLGREMMTALVGDADVDSFHQAMLDGAIESYTRAIEANALISGARLWRVAARVARDGTDVALWRSQRKQETIDALRFDPSNPALWRVAGDLAWRHNDVEAAREWYRVALSEKQDDLETIVQNLLTRPEGEALVNEVVPVTGPALRRLAQYYFDNWRFADATETFAAALRLEGAEPIAPTGDETLLDGDFNLASEKLLHPWIVEPARGVSVARIAEPDQRSLLQVHFRRGPTNWYHVVQQVPVQPGRRYRLSALVRVEDFASSDTFGVEAVHPYAVDLFAADTRCHAGRSKRSSALPASDGRFVRVQTDFVVPDGLRLLTVRLRRFSGKQESTGTVEFTGVSLQLLPEPEETPDAEG